MSERDLTREIEALEKEKLGLPYAWLKENGKAGRYDSIDWKVAERATKGRRREILDLLSALRAQRRQLIGAAREAREQRAAENRREREEKRNAVTEECQVCEHQQCVTPSGHMVLHGYSRPGHGWIEGKCFGAYRLPYPAIDALREYLAAVTLAAERTEAALAKLPGLTEIHEVIDHSRFTTRKVVRSEVDAVTWSRLIENERFNLDGRLRQQRREIERCKQRIRRAEGA